MNLNKIKLKRGYFNEEIAELIGIIYGDGNLFIDKKNGYRINITGNKETDYDYLVNYVTNLFERNFNIKPKIWIYKYRKAIALNIFSKRLLEYFVDLGIKVGPKKNLIIPEIILKNKRYKARFLRGLLDTDFCLYFEKKKRKTHSYPKLSTMFSDPNFTNKLKELFLEFNINSYLYNKKTKLNKKIYLQYGIDIYGKNNLNKIVNNINFKNDNHLTKLKLWQNYGYCNSHMSLNDRLNILNNKV